MAHCTAKCEKCEIVNPKERFQTKMYVKEKRLLGAGPSNMPNRVAKALSNPMMGHLHPETLQVNTNRKSTAQLK